MAAFNTHYQVTQEIIDDWAVFNAYVLAYIRRELEMSFDIVAQAKVEEFQNETDASEL